MLAVHVLLIDNHDSFTYNLAHLVFAACGEMPEVILAEEVTPADLARAERIIISPGPGRAEEYPWYPGIFTGPQAPDVPILGVCLGFQGLCQAFGAHLGRAEHPRHGEVTEGHTRYHSLAITELPECLEATEYAADGTLMAVRHRFRPLSGVQYHPESIASEGGVELMREFLGVRRVECWRLDVPADAAGLFRANFAADPGREAVWLDSSDGSGWTYLGSGSRRGTLDDALPPADTTSVPCDFALGWVGWITYEGEETFLFVDRALAISPAGEVYALGFERWDVVPSLLPCSPPQAKNTSSPPCSEPQAENTETQAENTSSLPCSTPQAKNTSYSPLLAANAWRFRDDRATYLDKIARAQEDIARGDSYELCLTTQLECTPPEDTDLLATYEQLRAAHPAPFSAYLNLAGTEVASISPERLLRIGADGTMEAKPIKGTRPRGATPEEDAAIAAELASSVKDRAENLMICDLLRNDLSRVAVPGSVHVPHLCAIESFSTVHQMVSTIRATRQPGVPLAACIRSVFPGGSMTGAPKERSMQLLDALEDHLPRGIYSGAIGYVSLSGACDFSVVIRTVVLADGIASYGVGGAITRLSDPAAEWEEICTKAAPLLQGGAANPRD